MRLVVDTAPQGFGGEPPNQWKSAFVVVTSIAAVALLDAAVAPDLPLTHLYYLPIMLAGIRLGWRGGLAAAVASITLFHVFNPALAMLHYAEADVVQLTSFVVVAFVSARLAHQAHEMRRLAATDDLTGLHNLRSFEAMLKRELLARANVGTSASMLGLDVDRLKALNDTFGHLTGADAVRYVGKVLAEKLPARATACRYGGDEFIVFVPRCDETEARHIAEHLCAQIRLSSPVLAGRAFEVGTLSVSIGVATRGISGTADPVELGEQLFHEADAAMYAAKRNGRGLVVSSGELANGDGGTSHAAVSPGILETA